MRSTGKLAGLLAAGDVSANDSIFRLERVCWRPQTERELSFSRHVVGVLADVVTSRKNEGVYIIYRENHLYENVYI